MANLRPPYIKQVVASNAFAQNKSLQNRKPVYSSQQVSCYNYVHRHT